MSKMAVKEKRERRRKFPDPSILARPGIPAPLAGLNPRTVLGQTWWDRKRKEAYARFDRKCWACGEGPKKSGRLYGHEVYDYDYRKGSARLREVVALCSSCHNFIHGGRWEVLLAQGKITQAQYERVVDRGVRILKKHRLHKKWLARHNPGHKGLELDLLDNLLKRVSLRPEIAADVALGLTESEIRMVKKELPNRVTKNLVDAGWGVFLDGEAPKKTPNVELVIRPPAKFAKERWAKWHLVIDGKKYYSRFKDHRESKEHYDRTRIDSISGRATCHSKNTGNNNLYIYVLDITTGRLVQFERYKRVGKRRLEKGFPYCVIGIPPGKYYVRASKRAPGRNLGGKASVTVVAGKATRNIDIELTEASPRKHRPRKKLKAKKRTRSSR